MTITLLSSEVCPHCAGPILPEAKYCGNCGAHLPTSTSKIGDVLIIGDKPHIQLGDTAIHVHAPETTGWRCAHCGKQGTAAADFDATFDWCKDCVSPTPATPQSDTAITEATVAHVHCHKVFSGHPMAVRRVAFSADGKRLYTAGEEGTLRIWNVATRQCVKTWKNYPKAVFAHDGRYVATDRNSQPVAVYHTDANQKALSLKGALLWDAYFYRNELIFSPSGALLARLAFVRKPYRRFYIDVWRTETGANVYSNYINTTAFAPTKIAFSPDARWLAFGNHLLDLTAGSNTPTRIDFLQPRETVTSLTFAPNNRLLVAGTSRGRLVLCDALKACILKQFTAGPLPVTCLAFTPNGQLLISGAGEQGLLYWRTMDPLLRIWRMSTGEAVGTWRGHTEPVLDLTFSTDGQWLASAAADKTVRLWGVPT